jgi:hypothetical protein
MPIGVTGDFVPLGSFKIIDGKDIGGSITGSEISASNSLFASTSFSGSHTSSNVVLINTATGELYHTSSYGSGGSGTTPTLQEVMDQGETTTIALTSSADISSSADIKGDNGVFASDVTAADDIFIGDRLMHYGDTSTLIGFETDFIYFSASKLEFAGPITASIISASDDITGGSITASMISASNSLFISTSLSGSHTSSNVVLINTATGELYHTSSYGAGGSGTGTPGGSNTDIQFNDGGGTFGGTSSFTFEKNADASIFVDGPITASGDISSSNSLFISTSLSGSHTNSSVVLINTLTGELYHTSSYGSGVPTLQQVMSQGETTSVALTSSADISSSATIRGRDGIFTRDLTAVDDMFLGDKLIHYGDTSTLIGFETDFIYFSASRSEFAGSITASGDISSSNSLFISTSESSSAHTSKM